MKNIFFLPILNLNQYLSRCLLSLNKLSELRKSDKKVQHNRIVAQFYMVNCTGSDESAKNFMKIRKQVWSLHLM